MTISPTPSPPSATQTQQQQQQRRAKSELSPMFPRLSRVPEIPGITEDDEPSSPTTKSSRHVRKPSHEADCSSEGDDGDGGGEQRGCVGEEPFVDFSSSSKTSSRHRKPRRRESGLMIRTEALGIARPCSPLPARHQDPLLDPPHPQSDCEGGPDLDQIIPVPVILPTKSKLKDVTNSPPGGKKKRDSRDRKALVVVVDNIRAGNQQRPFVETPKTDDDVVVVAVQDVNPIPPRGFATPPRVESPEPSSSLALPAAAAEAAATTATASGDQDTQVGREKRVRRSVNYAEPKLNT